MNATQGGGVRTGQVAREMRCSSRRDTRVMRHSADAALELCPLWGVGSARTAGRSLFWSVIVLKPYCEPERHSKMHVRSARGPQRMRFYLYVDYAHSRVAK